VSALRDVALNYRSSLTLEILGLFVLFTRGPKTLIALEDDGDFREGRLHVKNPAAP
jgi:hypothetical protein